MKSLFSAILAIAVSASASATHHHSNDCPKDCAVNASAIAPVTKSYDKKVAELKDVVENKTGMLNYNKTMQATLNTINIQKHLVAIENLESENAFNSLMANLVQNIDQQKLTDQLEDLSAAQRFEDLMVSICIETASK